MNKYYFRQNKLYAPVTRARARFPWSTDGPFFRELS
jgi:hypothetical protein